MERHRWKLMLKDRTRLFTLNATVVTINESIAFKKDQNKQRTRRNQHIINVSKPDTEKQFLHFVSNVNQQTLMQN